MGAPGGTYFCKNGHIVYQANHHEIGYEDQVKKCNTCGSTDIRFVCEWGDSEYEDPKIGPVVPFKPIKHTAKYISVKDIYKEHSINGEKILVTGKLFMKVLEPRYDVHRLFKEE